MARRTAVACALICEWRAAQIIDGETTADSAIRLTLLEINAPPESAGQLELGFRTRRRLRVFDRDVDIRIEREAGRADLNTADPALLSAIFIAGDIDPAQARSFASRIVD